jgi:hypothetical protein
MTMKNNKQTRRSLHAVGLMTIALLGYQNCAPGALSSKGSISSTSSSSFSDCGGAVCEVADVHTAAISDSQNLLAGMVVKAGVTAPSTKTSQTFAAQSGKMPATGDVSQITAPAWMAVATLGSEVCNDLLDQETAANATRRFFNSIDFTRGPASVTANMKSDVIRRLARNFWGRNESAAESLLIKTAIDGSFSGATASDTRNEMLYLCTAMIASTDAQKY